MRRPVDAEHEPRGKTVLVVDDDPSLRLLCRVNLELDGHRVVESRTVGDARAALGDGGIDVVLLDVHVGGESGLDLLDDVEALELPVRVVMLSGTSDISPEVRARVDGVLGKPFDLGDLAAAVRGEESGRLRRL
jgi:DNA-binding NtrC family response regulator